MVSYWRVALPTPLAAYFDYLPPAEVAVPPVPGIRVQVPLGARTLVGILLAVVDSTDIPLNKLKPVLACLDETPVMDPAVWRLCQWASEYYHHPLGEVLITALPKRLRAGKSLPPLPTFAVNDTPASPLALNAAQQTAVDAMVAATRYQCFVLAGVTGSGKTEVYWHVIAAVLARGQQALLLVPEIGLTPQTVARLQQRFNVPMAVMHSRLTEKERAQCWLSAAQGQARIVVGTRSAIFAPLPALGLIVVDEEHDASFKSHSGWRYSARDLAVMRAYQAGVPVILGSATPSLESYYNAQQGRYQWLVLPERAGTAQLPRVRIIDVRQQPMTAGMSPALVDAMRAQLAAGHQVLLFINRRGYAPVLMCHACGFIAACQRCDARMTVHQQPQRLWCHHCDAVSKPPKQCPKCHQAEMMTLGQGTEQLETALQALFPDYRVLRIDRDTTSRKDSLQTKLDQINACEADILVGTQMLAKGHHFANLGMCAILDVDSAFFSVDFRAMERMAQLLVQVAGRAGRGDVPGEVLIQTHHPEYPQLTQLFSEGYPAFLADTLTERARAQLPPFCHQALLRAESTKRERAQEFLVAAKRALPASGLQVLGPVPALMERRAGRYRHQLLVQATSRQRLQACLAPWRALLAALPGARQVRWSLDVDPIDMG